ncbi:MAG TPA: LuxR C-terminal-related transcriptional regulator, partial [Ktedonobacteraceae bacterium]
TTLLSAWHAELCDSDYPFAWVSLDAGDNDPARFWSYVLVALNTLHDGASDGALTLLRSPQPPPMELVLTSTLNALTTLSKDAVLVLDNYHVIETQQIHQALTHLLGHLPPRLRLVIATRVDPPLQLARLRVRGALTEVRGVDLRLSSEETTTLLTKAMGLPLSAEQVSALEARTEGWIAGLQLAALSAQGRPAEALEQFIEAFTGSNRYVVEYLVEEVLERQTVETQRFLLRTAVLDRMCAPLCDAVLNSEKEGAKYDQSLNARFHLEQLERANLFLISIDDEGNWYRYHNLFADVLRSRLKQTQPKLVPELHRRVSTWYEQHGLFNEAVQHALKAPDFELAARLIEQVGLMVRLGLLPETEKIFLASAYNQTLLAAGAKHTHEPATPLFKSKEPHSRSSQPLLEALSERELEVLCLVANGDSNCKIAEQLFVAVSTVKRHVSNIFSKLGVTNRTQAVARAREFGIL